MRTISIRLDDRTDAVLTAFCERHNLTQTAALKAAIEHLADATRPTPAALAAQFGLIGAFRSGERDLAANHSQRVKERLCERRTNESLPPADAPKATARRRSPSR